MVNDEALQVVHAAEHRYLHDSKFHAEVEQTVRAVNDAHRIVRREKEQLGLPSSPPDQGSVRLGVMVALYLSQHAAL